MQATVIQEVIMVDLSLALTLFVVGYLLGLGSFIVLGLWLNKRKSRADKFNKKLEDK